MELANKVNNLKENQNKNKINHVYNIHVFLFLIDKKKKTNSKINQVN